MVPFGAQNRTHRVRSDLADYIGNIDAAIVFLTIVVLVVLAPVDVAKEVSRVFCFPQRGVAHGHNLLCNRVMETTGNGEVGEVLVSGSRH